MSSALDRTTDQIDYTRHDSSLKLTSGIWDTVPTQALLDGLAEFGHLTKLAFWDCTFRDLAQLQVITMALPALNDLQINGHSTWELALEDPPYPGPAPSLQNLELDIVPRQCMSDLTDWIVATPAPVVLQTLYMTMETLEDTPTEIIAAARGLEELHLFYDVKCKGFEEDDDDIGASIGEWLQGSTALQTLKFTCFGVFNVLQLHSFFKNFADLTALTQLEVQVYLSDWDGLEWQVIGGFLERRTLARFELTIIGGSMHDSEGLCLDDESYRAGIEAAVRKWPLARTSVELVLTQQDNGGPFWSANYWRTIVQTLTVCAGPTAAFESQYFPPA